MARGLTDKQRTVLEVVERFWRERGMAPSVADVAEAIEVGRSTAYQHLVALKKKGFVDHTTYDTTSILAFISKRFGLELLPGIRTQFGDLRNAFAFGSE